MSVLVSVHKTTTALADHIASSRSTLTCYGGEGVKVPARLKVQS